MNIVNTSVLIAYFESIEVYCTDMHLQLKENQHNALAVKSCLTIETPAPLQSTVLFGSGQSDIRLSPSEQQQLDRQDTVSVVGCLRSRQTLWRTSQWNGYVAVPLRIHQSSPSILDA